jgi:hypothetical protein
MYKALNDNMFVLEFDNSRFLQRNYEKDIVHH